MTHPQQTTREVLEQCVQALNHCMDAITERGLNGSPDQAEKWGLQLPLERGSAALAAGQQALEQTQVEAEPEWNDENVIAYCIARGISAAKAFTTGATQPQATEPAPSPEVLQALTDPESQPNQFGVVFGMRGPRMFFTIGNQSFDLAYEPDSTEEFEFMKRMLCSAFSTFTPDVRTAPAPSTAGERDRTIVSLPIPASASDLKSDIAELIQSHKYKGLLSIEVLGVFQFLGAEIISGSNS